MMERKWDSQYWKSLIVLLMAGVLFSLGVYLAQRQTLEPPLKEEQESPLVVQKNEEVPVVELPDHLRHLAGLTVRVKAGNTEGSGLLVQRGETPYLWTAGYVVENLRKVKRDPRTDGRIGDTWFPATIIILKGDGHCEIPADVIRYGGPLAPALLRLREKLFLPKSTVFIKEGISPKIGAPVWHTTPFIPLRGMTGNVKEIGRMFQGTSYDIITPIGVPGSGGGGVFTEEGVCLGMVMRGTIGFHCFILPSRDIHVWAGAKGVAWAIDPAVPMPSEEELKKLPIED